MTEIIELPKTPLRPPRVWSNEDSSRQSAPSSGGGGNAVDSTPSFALSAGDIRLTLESIHSPAYVVNARFELEWWNDKAGKVLFGDVLEPTDEIGERSLFRLFCNAPGLREIQSWKELLDFHMGIAKKRLSKKLLWGLDCKVDDADLKTLLDSYDGVNAADAQATACAEVNLASSSEAPNWFTAHAALFREGVFFAFEAPGANREELLIFLSRRDLVIKELLRRRRPYLTPLAVLVADLQDSVKICTELPPEEYFELINHVWAAMGPELRKFRATHGKHVGDGMVYYFLPQPDSNYVYNALRCAFKMKQVMVEVSGMWRERKDWFNELKLNIGIHEGEEWFGAYQTPTHVEVTVLGDTINMAARLSDFAQEGGVWVTKSLVGKLSYKERPTLKYGIRRKSESGKEFLVKSTYSRISNLVNTKDPYYHKLTDIAMLAVTEVTDLKPV